MLHEVDRVASPVLCCAFATVVADCDYHIFVLMSIILLKKNQNTIDFFGLRCSLYIWDARFYCFISIRFLPFWKWFCCRCCALCISFARSLFLLASVFRHSQCKFCSFLFFRWQINLLCTYGRECTRSRVSMWCFMYSLLNCTVQMNRWT